MIYAVGEKFTGKERDAETGLDYFGARYLGSAMGRFGSPDPFNPILEFRPESDDPDDVEEARRAFDSYLSNPQQWNRYAYALNNPTKYVDRDGKIAILPILAVAWAAYEIGSAVYDTYTAYKTVRDPNASTAEKSAAVAGLAASALLVGSQNRIRHEAQRFVTVNCYRIPALLGFGRAAPSLSFWKRGRGTARHMPFEATFWAMWTAVRSVRRILGSIHRPPTVQAETADANYAASRQKYRWWRPPRRAIDVTAEFGDGLFSTGRRFGASFPNESWMRSWW